MPPFISMCKENYTNSTMTFTKFDEKLEEDGTLGLKSTRGNKKWVAVLDGEHDKYNYDRDFVAYQQPKTSSRARGKVSLNDGDVLEEVQFSHGGNEKYRRYYVFDADASEFEEIDEDEVDDRL